MERSHRYHAYPTQEVAAELQHNLDIHRQLYNHVRRDYENGPEDDKPSEYGRVNFGIDSTRRRGLGATILLSLAPRD